MWGVDNFREPDRCQHLFTGEMKPYDTITHWCSPTRSTRRRRCISACSTPMHNRTPAVVLLSGIGSTPFFAPIALKTLISKEPLEENDRLLTSSWTRTLSPAAVLQHAGGESPGLPVFAVI